MRQTGVWNEALGAEAFGLEGLSGVNWNLGTPALVERAVRRGEAHLSAAGALVGESAVVDPVVLHVTADGEGFDRDAFDALQDQMRVHAGGRELFVQDLRAGESRTALRVFSEHAWRALFAASSFEQPSRTSLASFQPAATVLDLPSFRADRVRNGFTGPFVAIDAERAVVLAGGGASASMLMHSVADALSGASAPAPNAIRLNAAVSGGRSVALFVGADGSGKSSLVGDAALGDGMVEWSTRGLSGLRRAQRRGAPTSGFGAVIENATLDPETREPQSAGTVAVLLAEPTAAPQPSDLFILARDSFGVLPPIAILDPENAVRFMILGYAPEMGEDGPQASFKPGFGDVEDLTAYGEALAGLIIEGGVRCWLVNTGWVGPADSDERRVPIEATRALVSAARAGLFDDIERRASKLFGFEVPVGVTEVDAELFRPRRAFGDKHAFLSAARSLHAEFEGAARMLGLADDLAPRDEDDGPFRQAAE